MKTPRINIDLKKIEDNAHKMKQLCDERKIKLTGVVKGSAGDIKVAKAFKRGGIDSLADSRLENIIKMRESGFKEEIILCRLPRLSEVDNIIEYVDISLVSEIITIKALGQAAIKKSKKHGIIVMVDVGDLREGVLPENIEEFFQEIKSIEGVEIKGLGTNVGCYGGILPSLENTEILVRMKAKLEKLFSINIPLISGGNTATTKLFEKGLSDKINHMRIGEAILLGTDVTNQRKIPHFNYNTFTMSASIIEIKNKPSVPRGQIGHDAFGYVPQFVDKGIRKRGILAIGRQDVAIEGLSSIEAGVDILGASSDHLIVDITDYKKDLKIGDELSFNINYGAMLSLMNSDYVTKNYLK